jgi:hypothetical protein
VAGQCRRTTIAKMGPIDYELTESSTNIPASIPRKLPSTVPRGSMDLDLCNDHFPTVNADGSLSWCGQTWHAAVAATPRLLNAAEELPPGSPEFWTNLGLSVMFVMVAGFVAGMTMVSAPRQWGTVVALNASWLRAW